MAFRWKEQPGGNVQFDPPMKTRRFKALGAPSSLPAGDFFSAVAQSALSSIEPYYFEPALGGILYRQDIRLQENYYAKEYEAVVPYTTRKRETGAYQINVDQTGGIVHVTAGTRISGWGPTGGGVGADEPNSDEKVDNGGLIGVDGDEIHGTDIEVEETKITVMFRHPGGILNPAYIKRVGRLTGYVNSDPFLTYEPGEVKYVGGNFGESNTEATAQYSYAISPNIKADDGLVIGGISVEEKAGWDLISPVYSRDVENGRSVRKLLYIEVIRPAGREWKSFTNATTGFGWGS